MQKWGIVSLLALYFLAGTLWGGGLKMLGWQFHDYDVEYVRNGIEKAERMGVNTVVFSHRLVYYTEEILDDERRAQDLAYLADTAHAHNMRVFIWVHELNAVPENLLKDGKVDFDNPKLFLWLREKYERLLKVLPQIDGIILTLRETPYKVFKSDVIESTLPPWERIAKLCNTINSVLCDAGKTLIVRTFLYEPWELEWMMQAFPLMDKDIVIMSKCVPHDWQPFYPPNPVLGKTYPHQQIMELDLACEAGGVDVIPYCQVDEVKRWVDYAREKGLYGIIARVDFGSRHALGGLNEINLYALSQFFCNPKISPDEVWQGWCRQKYGERAGPYVERALRRTTDIVKKTTYVLTFWVSKHHNLPSYKYTLSHIICRSTAKWAQNPKFDKIEHDLIYPTEEVFEKIMEEKREAYALVWQSINDIKRAKRYLEPQQYEELLNAFLVAEDAVKIWSGWAKAFWAHRTFLVTKNPKFDKITRRALRELELLVDDAPYGISEDGKDRRGIKAFVEHMRWRIENPEEALMEDEEIIKNYEWREAFKELCKYPEWVTAPLQWEGW